MGVSATWALSKLRPRSGWRGPKRNRRGMAADYLVSRDEDMTRDLDLTQQLSQHGVQTITVQQFLNLLETRTGGHPSGV